jgi:tetratricopeptide (TPR) repeat protein
MGNAADFDLQAAHRYFAAECFNRAWDFIEKPERTRDEADQMLALGMASLWHWQQREDHTPKNLAVGNWQMSRIHALRGELAPALAHAQKSLEIARSASLPPFYLGYAYEALARCAATAGDRQQASAYLDAAREAASQVTDREDQQLLLQDISAIGGIV